MRNLMLVIFLAFLLPSFIHAQDKAEAAISTLFNNYPQEKVVLNLSKQQYLAGESIYLKAYVLSGYQLSDISTNLYVELYDKNKTLVQKSILPLFKGTTEASMALESSMPEGVYYLRAYTHWMLNFGEAMNYLQPIRIYNPYSSNKIVAKEVRLNGRLYPESGILLSGVQSKLAIRLNAEESLPEHWEGSLFEKGNSNAVASTKSLNSQVALLEFIPAAGMEYTVKLKDNKGNEQELPVPAIQQNGVLLQVNNNNDNINYTIYFRSANTTGEGYRVIGTVNDEIVLKALVKKSKGRVDGSFSTKDLPNGVLNLTVFDEKGNPVAQRLTFIKPLSINKADVAVSTDTLSSEEKGYNRWSFTPDSTAWFSYSIQVNDADFAKEDNFFSQLYLTSDFPTAIDHAEWYFNQTDETKGKALDALLITENWQRFDWKELLANQFPVIKYSPEKYLSYIGTVTRKDKIEKLKDVNLVFKAKEGPMQFATAPIDSLGRVYLTQFMFLDTVNVYYQLNNSKNSAKNISIKFQSLNEFFPLKQSLPAVAYTMVPRRENDKLPAEVARAAEATNSARVINEKIKMMEEVVIRYNRRTASQKLNEELSSGLFRSMNETVFDFVNEQQNSATGYQNILDWLVGRVPGMQVRMGNMAERIPYLRNQPVPVYLDEMPVDAAYLTGMSINDIAMVKVIRGAFYGGVQASDGAIAIYTRRGGMHTPFLVPDLPMNTIIGYKKQEAFFSPVYDQKELKTVDDKRGILARQDFMVPDNAGKVAVSFYNNDVSKSFRVYITGFTADGQPIHVNRLIGEKQ